MKKILIALFLLAFTSQIIYAETVIYNPQSGIYHNTGCHIGNKCKKCVRIDKKEAQKKGRACKTCGG